MEQIKVLLIDSDEANREFLSRMLHKKYYEVSHASTMMSNFSLANNQHVPILTKFPLDTASMVLKQAALEMSRQAISSKSAA